MSGALPPVPPEGLVVVDKPAGWTSHDVVGKLRRLASTRKVGHAGTLDPMATGVLVCGIGRATRLLGHLALTDKTYTATIRLGVVTTTDDAEGEVVDTCPVDAAPDAVQAAMAGLTGSILQVPSSVSAIKVDGERAYARVRAGETVELAARAVTVSRFALLERRDLDEVVDLDVVVDCSTGTYVRALARDLGAVLGCGGHLTALRRSRVGDFDLATAAPLEQLVEAGSVDGALVGLPDAVARTFPARTLSDDEAREVSFGRRIAASGRTGPVGAFAADGTVMALVEDREDDAGGSTAKPILVFRPAGS